METVDCVWRLLVAKNEVCLVIGPLRSPKYESEW